VATPTITALYRYPVKGLSPERLPEVTVSPGETFPFDRMYAIENGPGAFDAAAPRHLPKVTFLCLMRDERLATLQSIFEPSATAHNLTIARDGCTLATGDLKTAAGRASIEAVFAREMAGELRGPPRVVSAMGHSFSDVKEKCVHIVNLASVRALEHSMGRSIDPLRFRANIVIDGLEPWAELGLVGQTLRLGTGYGGATLHVFKRTVRCAATNVDPVTGARDADVPHTLERLVAHRDFGVYAMVTNGGLLSVGDPVTIS
jgi:uncharacterized protein